LRHAASGTAAEAETRPDARTPEAAGALQSGEMLRLSGFGSGPGKAIAASAGDTLELWRKLSGVVESSGLPKEAIAVLMRMTGLDGEEVATSIGVDGDFVDDSVDRFMAGGPTAFTGFHPAEGRPKSEPGSGPAEDAPGDQPEAPADAVGPPASEGAGPSGSDPEAGGRDACGQPDEGGAPDAAESPEYLDARARIMDLIDTQPPPGWPRWTIPSIARVLGIPERLAASVVRKEGLRLEKTMISPSNAKLLTEMETLEMWVRGGEPDHVSRVRAAMILESLDGVPPSDTARRFGVTTTTVASWKTRFLNAGAEGVRCKPKGGITSRAHFFLKTKPPQAAATWTAEALATALGAPLAWAEKFMFVERIREDAKRG
jgi:hypothetical protein